MEQEFITLRGHHLRLLEGFVYGERESYIWNVALEDHGRLHADNMIRVLRNISTTNTNVKIVDVPDDICETCDEKETRACKTFLPYGVSAASDDRATCRYYDVHVNRVYKTKHILEQLQYKGRMP